MHWLLFSAIILAVIVTVILFFVNPNATTPYSTAIIAIATVVYAFYSIRNYIEIKKQNEFLSKKIIEDYKLERKKPTLDLLHEINLNELILKTHLKTINDILDTMIELDENRIIKLSIENIPYLKKLRDTLGSLDNKPYVEFSKHNISFKSDELNSKIEMYFNPILIMPFIYINSFLEYVQSQEIKSQNLLKKIKDIRDSIDRILRITKEIYDIVHKDLGINYRQLPEYM